MAYQSLKYKWGERAGEMTDAWMNGPSERTLAQGKHSVTGWKSSLPSGNVEDCFLEIRTIERLSTLPKGWGLCASQVGLPLVGVCHLRPGL